MTTKLNDNPQFYISSLKRDNAELTKQNYDLMKKYTVKTSDPVINDVIDRIFKRHQQGMEKFKKTMADNSKSIPEWIEESIQEKIDDICYMSTLKDRIVANEEKLKKEMAFVREQAQVDILTKDQELGRAYKKINELSDGKKT
jgi:hypothetical protein|tara:strand:+ start:106 stop:534 length:429 start_codon:yes stop_codon:yes gene_type:complete